VKFRVTLTHEYEPNPEHYPDKDPVLMAELDQENFRSYPDDLVYDLFENGVGPNGIKVEVVEE
jgi:hypothetical protein